MPACLARAFSSLKLFCMANRLQVFSIRSFTTANMHAARNAFPWLGCKGADPIVILKWMRWYSALELLNTGWSVRDRSILFWISSGAKAGLAFSQGIHGHGIWLGPSCVAHLKHAVQHFGNAYAHLAHHCLNSGYCLFGQVPKLHSYMHFRTDFDDSTQQRREHTLNPAVFDNSMSEDFIGRVARQSRRVPFRGIEKTILRSYQVKAKFAIDKFKKCHRHRR